MLWDFSLISISGSGTVLEDPGSRLLWDSRRWYESLMAEFSANHEKKRRQDASKTVSLHQGMKWRSGEVIKDADDICS